MFLIYLIINLAGAVYIGQDLRKINNDNTSTDNFTSKTNTISPYMLNANINPLEEAKLILNNIWSSYWNGNGFSASSCGSVNTPVVWDIAVTLQSFADGEQQNPNEFTSQLSLVYDYMNLYYNSNKMAYSPSQNKDNDLYYDDNAQIASALLTAYNATKDSKYLNRAQNVLQFLEQGWNDKIGGVTWHLGYPYVASISTLETALASFRLYKAGGDSSHLAFAEDCMNWIGKNLWDNSTNLIMDGINSDSGDVNKWTFTYQTGTAISLSTYLYEETKNIKWKNYADTLVESALDHAKPIYDSSLPLNYRFWKDGFDFIQLLTEGFSDYLKAGLGNDDVKNELIREAQYTYTFAKSSDGLYFNQINPIQNSEVATNAWNTYSKESQKSNISNNVYCNGNNGQVMHDLINDSAVAHLFFKTGVIVSSI
ncbi:hypothetical protein DAMA08_004540 [Martiniozyma asiatica (nom. inval.)]|nr:hypothetical protein DAMA08_004540 [Martiniozyma asiatica]